MIKDKSRQCQAAQSPCSLDPNGQEVRTIEEVEERLPLAFTDYTRSLFGDNLYHTFLIPLSWQKALIKLIRS